MTFYKSHRIIGWVIVDENGNIINRNPSKEKLKGLEEELEKCGNRPTYTDEELLNYLRQFYKENGKIPTQRYFANNPEYPNFVTYVRRFGSWSNALKLVWINLDTMIKNGIIETTNQKARLAEIKVINHFGQHPVDLAGENQNSPCDGICPNGKTFDVKSSKFYKEGYWAFVANNKYKEDIEIYYFLAFNEDWTKLEYGWRVPGEVVEKDYFRIGLNTGYEFNIENMKEYNITDKFKDII